MVEKLTRPLISIHMEYEDAKDNAGENITKKAIFDIATINDIPYVI